MKRFISFFRKWLLPFILPLFLSLILGLLHEEYNGLLYVVCDLPVEQVYFIFLSGILFYSYGQGLFWFFSSLFERKSKSDQEDRA